jgi:hypothetical protein
MDMQLKGYILIDIKSFIECFESITWLPLQDRLSSN